MIRFFAIVFSLLAPLSNAADLADQLHPEARYYGVGWQSDGAHWSIEVILTANGAQVAYPSAKCFGKWTLASGGPDRFTYVEQITDGDQDCILLGRVALEPYSDDMLRYVFSETEGRTDAEAILLPVRGIRKNYMEMLLLTLNNISFDYLLPEYFE